MKLTPAEVKLIHQLRQLPTCKMTVVQVQGEIKSARMEVNTDFSSMPPGHPKQSENAEIVRTREVPRGTI